MLAGAVAVAGVVVDRPAAALAGGNEHVAAVLLQDAERGPMRVAEHGVGHAADEERHPGAAAADGRQELRQLRARLDRRRHQRDHLPQPAGDELQQAQPLGEAVEAQPLREPHRRHGQPNPVGVGKQLEQDDLAEPVVASSASVSFCVLHRQAERLDQPAVVHARGAGRLARPAVEAQLQMPLERPVGFEPAVGHQPHQVDPAARAVVLVAQFGVRRARRRTQAAVDAVEKQVVVDGAARAATVRLRTVFEFFEVIGFSR